MRRLALFVPLLLACAGCINGTKTTATPSNGATVAAPTTTATSGGADGKALFASQGCAACHTFTPAGASGKIGPNLDHLAADAKKANQGSLAAYTLSSIKDPGAYVVPGFQNVMPTSFASLPAQQLDALVAFLTQNQKS